jgi:predicted sugar kinase
MKLRRTLAGFCLLALAGCGTTFISTCNDSGGGYRLFGKKEKNVVEQKLDIGVKEYEDGNYLNSMEALKSVLDTNLADKGAKVNAYKYLAFIHCISAKEAMCKDYFSKVLEIDPTFELSAAEAGHPIWGPAFRSVKDAQSRTTRPNH